MLSFYKPKLEKNINYLAKYFVKVNPNLLTLIGSIPPLLFFVFLAKSNYIPAIIIFPFLASDALDGAVARMSHRVTAFGGFLDSVLDRISDFLVITAFGFAGIVRWEIVVLFLISVYLVSYARSRGELASNNTVKFNIGIMERTERLIGIFVTLVLYTIMPSFLYKGLNIPEISFILFFVLSLITFLERVYWAYKKL